MLISLAGDENAAAALLADLGEAELALDYWFDVVNVPRGELVWPDRGIALLVLGPERLPTALRTLGLWLGRMRRSFNSVKTEIVLSGTLATALETNTGA